MRTGTVLAGLLLCGGLALAANALAADRAPLVIAEQGSFAAGGTVIDAREPYNPLKPTVASQTLHGDHAYVFFQIPEKARKYPLVFLHGAGQSARTWETTPDGREGCTGQGSPQGPGKRHRTGARAFRIFSCGAGTVCILWISRGVVTLDAALFPQKSRPCRTNNSGSDSFAWDCGRNFFRGRSLPGERKR